MSNAADKARYSVNSSNRVPIIFRSLEAHYVAQGKPGTEEKVRKFRGTLFPMSLIVAFASLKVNTNRIFVQKMSSLKQTR